MCFTAKVEHPATGRALRYGTKPDPLAGPVSFLFLYRPYQSPLEIFIQAWLPINRELQPPGAVWLCAAGVRSELLRRWRSEGLQTAWGNQEESGTALGFGREPGRCPPAGILWIGRRKRRRRKKGWRFPLSLTEDRCWERQGRHSHQQTPK